MFYIVRGCFLLIYPAAIERGCVKNLRLTRNYVLLFKFRSVPLTICKFK